MKSPLHILNLEDNHNDAALILSTLQAGGITCAITRVQTCADFVAALQRGGIDLILADYALPDFDGLSAAKVARSKWPDIPVILVSGTLGEERAIDALQSGATDYVLKARLSRLCPAVRRAMLEVAERAENRRNEQALRQAEERLKIIFNESSIGIALVEPDGRILLANAAFQKMLDYTDEELRRTPCRVYTHPDDWAACEERLRQLFQGQCDHYQVERRFLRKNGQVVWTWMSISLAHKASAQPAFGIAIVEDVTERRRLEEELVEAQKMEVIGQLTGGVAHDFNNLLAVIMGYSDLMMDKLAADSPLHKDAQTIRHAAERATGLTRQLLVFSRKQPVQPVVLDLNEVVGDMQEMLRRLIDENMELIFALGPQAGRLKADSGYVGQVLMNLVINARDAMPHGGKITVETAHTTLDQEHAREHPGAVPGDYVMLRVSDTGTGMTDEVKAHLFEAFFTTKPKGKGTGLGLATCQTIVQQCGGHIALSSHVGQGTTFQVYFPQVQDPIKLSDTTFRKKPMPRGTETLLVVEDDPAVRQLACEVLRRRGYEVLAATNGQDGLNVVHSHIGPPIRLVLTDVVMPQMGGKEMAEWLQSSSPHIKILYSSGYSDDAIAQHGALDQGSAFLPKPYTPATLTCAVRELLDQPS